MAWSVPVLSGVVVTVVGIADGPVLSVVVDGAVGLLLSPTIIGVNNVWYWVIDSSVGPI